ncbi:Arm DNA-binding domain-containing protein [Brenneria izbisi]|uniref:Arm DNA-binding domain-containing protein n=1 Tax=Brenneria izbisi TaxID=2939450 RepID=A0AA41Y400_9GAMM|nr:Arm DNA-binding domain-containing protein [Brenneria izbisi]MCV9880287.1 Arm DNA-binding domain-containing protein [Brenneria izbisi]MCV9883607.1 Arm DNA-binding domain-containing protein [Brenneria izbisi]
MTAIPRLLSAVTVRKAKLAAKDYELSDGHGLTLSIRTTGKKIWRFRYQRPNSSARTNITLGHYPAMTLAAARTLHDEYIALLIKGIDLKNRSRTRLSRKKEPKTACSLMWQRGGSPLKKPAVFPTFMPVISGVHWRGR